MLRYCIPGLLVLIGVVAFGQSPRAARFRILASQVVPVLSGSGIDVQASQIHMGTEEWATSSTPAMQVLELQRTPGSQSVWVKLGCTDQEQCRPFYVDARWNGPIPSVHKHSSPRPQARLGMYSPPAIRFGEHATLIVDNPRLHMEIAVIALQNGAVGQVIHLATPDRKQFYQGEVVNKSMLKGSL